MNESDTMYFNSKLQVELKSCVTVVKLRIDKENGFIEYLHLFIEGLAYPNYVIWRFQFSPQTLLVI